MESKFEFNFLGNTGVKVSNLCLGTMNFGNDEKWVLRDNPRQLNEERSHQIMDMYAKYGGTFLDTANVYSNGACEKIVGNWLAKQDRSRFVVATKVAAQMGDDVNGVGLSRRNIIDSLEACLERLQTNYVDLLQSHLWDSGTSLNETLRTFDDLIRCGKIRYFGASNLCGWQMQKIVCQLEALGLNPCVSLQQQYSLLCRQSEFEELMVCQREGIGLLAWSPLKGGLLTGKYTRKEACLDPVGSRLGVGKAQNIVLQTYPAWDEYVDHDGYWKLMDALAEIAAAHGKTIPQVALRWLLQKNVVSSVIIGVTSTKQLEDNIGAAAGWKLSDEEMQLLDDTSVRQEFYPYNMIYKFCRNRCNPRTGACNP